MSVDPVVALNYAATAVVIAILVLGIYRATEMRKAFVNRIYRNRATWFVILMSAIIITSLTNLLPIPSTGAGALLGFLLGFLPFLAVIAIVYAFVDRSVLVAIENDFFHRNTLDWRQLRWPAGIVLVVSMVIGGAASYTLDTGWEFLGFLLFLTVIPIVLSYATAALIVGARRTPDRALRRSILFLGLALSTLVISLVVGTPFSYGTLPYVVVNQGTTIVGMYLIYRSVMSLSPVGRIGEEIMTAAPAVR